MSILYCLVAFALLVLQVAVPTISADLLTYCKLLFGVAVLMCIVYAVNDTRAAFGVKPYKGPWV